MPNVRGVWAFARNLMIVVSLEQRYEGQAMQTLLAATGRRRIGGWNPTSWSSMGISIRPT